MIKELRFNEFEEFAKNHMLFNHYQTINYAMLMTEYDYDYDLIGYFENDELKAASLIIFKNLTNFKRYGYAPRGFLIDYLNPHLLERFTKELKEYYDRKNIVFIKINPELPINEIDIKTKNLTCNKNIIVKNYLNDYGYLKLRDNVYFESRLPRYAAFINLKDYDEKKIDKNTRNKIKRSEAKGLSYEIVQNSGIDILFDFVKKKRKKDLIYYKHYYNAFKKTNNVDVFLIKIDYNEYLNNAKDAYEKELELNGELNRKLIEDRSLKNINKKMESDKKLLSYKNDVMEATNGSKTIGFKYIAGAMVVKFNNRIDIIVSGFDTKYKRFNANYFLHNSIINYYKDSYEILDMNGITGDFTDKNPYNGLNNFKLGFKPKIYELIGEYDLILKPRAYKKLNNNGTLARVLNKTDEKELIQFK